MLIRLRLLHIYKLEVAVNVYRLLCNFLDIQCTRYVFLVKGDISATQSLFIFPGTSQPFTM